MPLDQFDDYWYEHNAYYFRWASWKSARPIFPRRCQLTGRLLWMQKVMRGVRIITGPGSDVVETYWVDPGEFMLHKIKYGY